MSKPPALQPAPSLFTQQNACMREACAADQGNCCPNSPGAVSSCNPHSFSRGGTRLGCRPVHIVAMGQWGNSDGVPSHTHVSRGALQSPGVQRTSGVTCHTAVGAFESTSASECLHVPLTYLGELQQKEAERLRMSFGYVFTFECHRFDLG